jgi:hypothetical protein
MQQSFLQNSANVNEVSIHENRPTIILISPYVGGLADEGVFHYIKDSSILGQCRPMQVVPRLEPDQTELISFFRWCIQHLKALCSNWLELRESLLSQFRIACSLELDVPLGCGWILARAEAEYGVVPCRTSHCYSTIILFTKMQLKQRWWLHLETYHVH